MIFRDPSLTCHIAVHKLPSNTHLDMQCIIRKRGHEMNTMALIDDIAFRFGHMCKRVLAFDLGVLKQPRLRAAPRLRSRSPDERRLKTGCHCCVESRKVKGKDALFWSQSASTLLNDVSQLNDSLKSREREYASLFEINSKLLFSFKELERKMIDAERELNYLRTDPFQETGIYSSVVSTIPVNTQGKDALYWHQTCRTVQLQYLEAKREVDEKTYQFSVLSTRIRELESMIQRSGRIK